MALVVLWSGGCVYGSTMDTARALPAGHHTTRVALGAGLQRGAMLRQRISNNPKWTPEQRSEGYDTFPFTQGQFELMAGKSYGLGYGLQLDGGIGAPAMFFPHLTLLGGVKWQLPMGERRAFAAAMAWGMTGSFMGGGGVDASATILHWGNQAGFIFSFHPAEILNFYISPRVRYDYLHTTLTRGGLEAVTAGGGWGWSGAAGIRLGVTPRLGLFFEGSTIQSYGATLIDAQHNDRYVASVGLVW